MHSDKVIEKSPIYRRKTSYINKIHTHFEFYWRIISSEPIGLISHYAQLSQLKCIIQTKCDHLNHSLGGLGRLGLLDLFASNSSSSCVGIICPEMEMTARPKKYILYVSQQINFVVKSGIVYFRPRNPTMKIIIVYLNCH